MPVKYNAHSIPRQRLNCSSRKIYTIYQETFKLIEKNNVLYLRRQHVNYFQRNMYTLYQDNMWTNYLRRTMYSIMNKTTCELLEKENAQYLIRQQTKFPCRTMYILLICLRIKRYTLKKKDNFELLRIKQCAIFINTIF